MIFASAAVTSFLLGLSATLVGERFPQHVNRLETAGGILLVSAFLLAGGALPHLA